jgi:hypothetical protein
MVGMMNNEIELKWLLSATLDEQTHLINEYRKPCIGGKYIFLKKKQEEIINPFTSPQKISFTSHSIA